ncbi:hypothetical protein BGZ88_012362 [Linnemannia elongata]|nr:hypothetical protein BGZ88_012362 [Linnemannia elongata]
MRFATVSLVLALSTTFSVTFTMAFPITNTNNNDVLLSQRHLYQRDVANSQLTDAAIDSSTPSSRHLRSHSSSSSGGARMINKRQGPRRLAGDKRGTGGLLDNLVGDIVPPKPATDAPSPNGETIIAKRGEDEDDTPDQETEATERDEEDEENSSGGQNPIEPASEEIINPSLSSIVEPTDSGSDQEPTPTATAGESEPTPKPEDEEENDGDKDESGYKEEPTPTPTPDDAATTTTEEPDVSAETANDSAPEPTDPVVAITSSSSTTTTSHNPSGQTDPTVTKTSKDEGSGPTTLPGHKEETNSNTTALTVGLIVAVLIIATFIGIWIFRKWKLSLSRPFKRKIIGGSTKGGAAASAVVYGSEKGHGGHSEYNSYDEMIRPEAYDIAPPPAMTSVSMVAPAYTAAVAGSEYEYGYAHYEQMQQQQQQQTMGGDTNYQSYQYGHSSGAVPAMSEASAMRASVTTIPNPNVIGGVPAVGHNIHGYGSEDYTRNDHFLRELRE